MQYFTSFSYRLAMFFIALFCLLPINANARTTIKESTPTALTAIIYSDENGKEQKLDTSKNNLTALHFWATWCMPCIKELPQVNAAQKKYMGKSFQIIALSLDGKNTDKVQKFYSDNKIDKLQPLFDSSMSAFSQLKIKGLPTTIFINSKGEEIARAEGELDWESNETEKFIKARISAAGN